MSDTSDDTFFQILIDTIDTSGDTVFPIVIDEDWTFT